MSAFGIAFVVLPAVALLFSCSRDIELVPSPGDNDPSGLVLELSAEEITVEETKRSQLVASIVNKGNSPAFVVLPGDGSQIGWRSPIVRWQPSDQKPCRFDGHINSLELDELKVLAPEERVRLEWLGAPLLVVGAITVVSLQIEHDPTLRWRGLTLDDLDSDAMRKLRRIPPYKLESNLVEVPPRE